MAVSPSHSAIPFQPYIVAIALLPPYLFATSFASIPLRHTSSASKPLRHTLHDSLPRTCPPSHTSSPHLCSPCPAPWTPAPSKISPSLPASLHVLPAHFFTQCVCVFRCRTCSSTTSSVSLRGLAVQAMLQWVARGSRLSTRPSSMAPPQQPACI